MGHARILLWSTNLLNDLSPPPPLHPAPHTTVPSSGPHTVPSIRPTPQLPPSSPHHSSLHQARSWQSLLLLGHGLVLLCLSLKKGHFLCTLNSADVITVLHASPSHSYYAVSLFKAQTEQHKPGCKGSIQTIQFKQCQCRPRTRTSKYSYSYHLGESR